MSQPGQQSTAHEYDKNRQCIHCGMYENNVIALSHDCTPQREAKSDSDFTMKQEEHRVDVLEGKDG
jgi:hypothetical protein